MVPFLKSLGLNQSQDWSVETIRGMIPLATYHKQIGSAITLRGTMLVKIIDALLTPLSGLTMSKNKIEIAQRVALYLHIRSAIELALRPVIQPYPKQLHVAWKSGLMSVSDKRVHHQQERRIIVLSESLVEVLQQYQSFCIKLDGGCNSANTSCLMYWDGKNWLDFNPKNITQLCQQYLDDIDPGCFRHICASQFIELAQALHNHYQQQALNQKMNHYQRGQNPLGEFAMLSIAQAIDYQRNITKTYLSSGQNCEFWQKIATANQLVIDVIKRV